MNITAREIKIFGSSLDEVQINVEYLTTAKPYQKKNNQKTDQSPLEKLFQDYKSALNIDSNTSYTTKKRKVDKEADLRHIWFCITKKLTPEEFDRLLLFKIFEKYSVRDIARNYNLLPEEKAVSHRIRTLELDSNLGSISLLPPEILIPIFQHVSFLEISAAATVSKYWFQYTTSSQIWASRITSTPKNLDPFTNIQHAHVTKKIWNPFKEHYIYATDAQVTCGQGLLVYEEKFIQGLKLNGMPIISHWMSTTYEMGQLMLRTRFLRKNEISPLLKDVELVLNEGTIDLLTLGDTLTPFLNCMTNGRYRLRVHSRTEFWLIGHKSYAITASVEGNGYSDEPYLYCTQAMDLLSAPRIKFYEDQIRQGKRPIVLTVKCGDHYFLIDGHHKAKAYKNLQMTQDMVMISIEACDPKKMTREEQLAYIQHSEQALALVPQHD